MIRIATTLLLLVLACVEGLPAYAASAPAQHTELHRGLNLSHWFAQSTSGYADAHLEGFVTAADLRRIHDAGFDHVRLGVDPDVASDPHGRTKLSQAVEALHAAGLNVVVDLHPTDAQKRAFASPDGTRALAELWKVLATTLARFEPAKLFLEVLNEPFPVEGATWEKLQAGVVGVIRKAAPLHTIIVNAGGWSGAEEITAMKPLADDNVIYTFHWYAPLLFTHQGATWTWDVARRVGPLQWPMPPADAADARAIAATDEEAATAVKNEVGAGRFDRQVVEQSLEKIDAWRSQHGNVPVYAGEFGVYGLVAPRAASLEWVRVARESFERRGLGWAYWDSSPSFGLIEMTSRGRELREDMLGALGMRRP